MPAVGDAHSTTLTFHEEGAASRAGPRPEPVLVLALECGRPRVGSTRSRLAELTAITLGRGPERRADRTGAELAIRVPDRWMSSRHARIEPSFGRWVLTDTESKNGTIVDGHTTKRAVLTDGSLIELGHTLFIFFERQPIEPAARTVTELAPDAPIALATLTPAWGVELGRVRQIAASDIAVLIEGDGGTGKETLARAIHGESGRAGAFVAVNCAAPPGDATELVRSADKGTLFLDEVGELPLAAQAALERVLHDRGGDARVVAATQRDLDALAAAGEFRHDLLARLAAFRLAVPTLAERRADLGVLIGALHARLFPAAHPGFDIEAARMLLRYPWPLNLRELEQALAAAQVLAGAEPVRAEHLPDSVRTGRPPGAPRPVVLSEADQKVRDQVVAALREHQGNVSAVARALDKDRKQIQRWIKRFNLDRESYR